MIHRNSFELDIHDVDYNGIARASALMRHMQTVAQNQLTENGMSYDELIKIHRAFLLSRITIEFNEPVRAYDRLIASTYPCESRGFGFLRFHALERNGAMVARAISLWALMDTETKSLVRVNNFNIGIDTERLPDFPLERFIMPHELDEVGSFFVTYTDTDQNRHMNNTRYPDMYANFLPLEGKRISKITINYQNEAPTGETLRVYRASGDDGAYYFKTVRGDGKVNSEALIYLTDI